MSNLKVEGKVGDFCLNCKNCKAVTRIHDGKNASIRIIEVDCEDPYDGMVKTLDADSDICCSMFEPKPPCEKCERFDGSYCHSPKMPREALEAKILDLFEEKNRLNGIINSLEKEKAAHLKGIERLKKSQEKLQNQVKNLKVYADENGQMYKELQEWREKCISRGNDIDHLLSENKEKDKKISELTSRVKYWSNKAVAHSEKLTETRKDRDKWRDLYNSLSETCADYDKRCKEECEKRYRDEISKLQNIVTEKEVEIKGLRKDNVRLNKDISWGNMIAEKNTELNQTISDQEITIKALLITIKEMYKEENENG